MHFAKAFGLLIATASVSTLAQPSLTPGEALVVIIDGVTCLSQATLEVAQNITKENAVELGGVRTLEATAILPMLTARRSLSKASAAL